MSQAFDKIKPEAKNYIAKNKETSNRDLAKELLERFSNKVSYKTIGNFKKSNEFSQLVSQLSQKIPKLDPQSLPSRSRKRGFDFSLDILKKLLDANPKHILHDELEHQFIGKVEVNNGKQKKTGGKLRADLMKLFSFLKDVTN